MVYVCCPCCVGVMFLVVFWHGVRHIEGCAPVVAYPPRFVKFAAPFSIVEPRWLVGGSPFLILCCWLMHLGVLIACCSFCVLVLVLVLVFVVCLVLLWADVRHIQGLCTGGDLSPLGLLSSFHHFRSLDRDCW